MKIKQCSEQVSMSPRTIRFYEEMGLIKTQRANNGYREYTQEDVERLQQIKLLRELGVSMEDVKHYFTSSIPLQEVLLKRKEELMEQKKDIQSLIEIVEDIEKQKVPLSKHTLYLNEKTRQEKNENVHPREYGKQLTSNIKYRLSRKSLLFQMVAFTILVFLFTSLTIYNLSELCRQMYAYPITDVHVQMLNICSIIIILGITFLLSLHTCKSSYFEVREDGLYFLNEDSTISSWAIFKKIMLYDRYETCLDFIHFKDMEMIKAGVQKSGMIMGGDYLFTFYFVIFTKDDKAVRLDSNLFYGKEHFMTTLLILHDKVEKWIDPNHVLQLLQMPSDKAYKILNTYYWKQRPWHKTKLYKRLKKKEG